MCCFKPSIKSEVVPGEVYYYECPGYSMVCYFFIMSKLNDEVQVFVLSSNGKNAIGRIERLRDVFRLKCTVYGIPFTVPFPVLYEFDQDDRIATERSFASWLQKQQNEHETYRYL